MKNFTIEQIRSFIREDIGWKTQLDDDNDICITFGDDDWTYDVKVYIGLNDKQMLRVRAIPVGIEIPTSQRAKILVALNKFNLEYNLIKGCMFDEEHLIFIRQAFLDEDVSRKYVLENEIRTPINIALLYMEEIAKML